VKFVDEKDGVEVVGDAIAGMVTREAVESKASERTENGGKDGSSRKMGMSIEGSKEVFLVGAVEDTRKSEGVSKCTLERVIVTRPEIVTDRGEVVMKEAKLFGVGGLPGFKGRSEGRGELNRGEE
jgi:hypothetical protein